MKFNGVGPKTAAIVLLFSLGRPAFPVDTHIYRVTGRIGLRPEKMTVEDAHTHLEKLFPPETYYAAHLNIIRLGREICADAQACLRALSTARVLQLCKNFNCSIGDIMKSHFPFYRKEVRSMLCIVQERDGLVEYAFILLLIALIVFAILAIFGSSIGNVFTRMNSSLPTY